MEWIFHKPVFECDKFNRDLLRFSPWASHRYFGYDLIAALKPNTLVELGSHYGSSFFAFAQAVKDFNLDTRLYAVDTWCGDDFTQHYDDEVYNAFLYIKENAYSKINITMLRTTFDLAKDQIPDSSIDILHIDGSHHYQDVAHDFNSWKPKVKEDGIILFHDISDDKVMGETMGSHVFWKEIKQNYPWTSEFSFSWGLGILFLNEQRYLSVKSFLNEAYYQALSNGLDIEARDILRQHHFTILSKQNYINDLKKQLETKDIHLEDYKTTVAGKDTYIKELLSELTTSNEAINNIQAELQKTISDYQNTIDKKDSYIYALEEKNNTLVQDTSDLSQIIEKVKNDYQETINEKDIYISNLEKEKAAFTSSLQDLSRVYQDKLEYIVSQQNLSIERIGILAKDLEDKLTELGALKSEYVCLKKEHDSLAYNYQQLETDYQKTLTFKYKNMKSKKSL